MIEDLQGKETVYLIRKTYSAEKDEYGKRIETISEIPVYKVLVAPGSSSFAEQIGRNPLTAYVTFYFPAGTSLKENDRLKWNGELWEKAGAIQVFNSPDGWDDFETGPVVEAKQVKG